MVHHERAARALERLGILCYDVAKPMKECGCQETVFTNSQVGTKIGGRPVLGGALGYFLGGLDGLLIALIVFVVLDYITGVMVAIIDKTLSSEVGFRGIFRKILIFSLVGVAHIVDTNIIGTGAGLRTAVIFFYLSNEGLSILENTVYLGLPVPEKLKTILAQLQDSNENIE